MAENSGGNAFLGVIVGALLIGLVVVGYFAMNGNFTNRHTLDVNVSAPSVPNPG